MKQLNYVFLFTLLLCTAAIFTPQNLNAQYHITKSDLSYYGENVHSYDYEQYSYLTVETNNKSYDYDRPDIYLDNLNVYATKVYAGQSVKISCEQYYTGKSNQYVYSKIAYYLSDDTQYDSSDKYLGNSISNLSSDYTYDYEYIYAQVPYDIKSGTKYLLFVADYLNEVYESNEENNVAYAKLKVANYNYEYVYNPYSYDYNDAKYTNNSVKKAPYHSYNLEAYPKMETYPNPVTLGDTFYLDFYLQDNYAEEVKLTVYDYTGKVVDAVYTNAQKIGVHYYEYDTSKLKVGTYHYTLTTGDLYIKNKLMISE